ncbi:MAG: transcriptional regulator, AraC family [Paenibacillus sp.]|nr:transcriptional regulator, AraC family [Paenibacillus sp.]
MTNAHANSLITHPVGTPFYMDKMAYDAPLTMTVDHIHEGYEMYYLCSGERNYFIRDRIYRIGEGDLVLIDKGVKHRTLNVSDGHMRIVLNFQDALFTGMPEIVEQWKLLALFEQPVLRLNRKQQGVVKPLLFKMFEEYESGRLDSVAFSKLMLAELLLYAVRCRREQQAEAEDRSESVHPMYEPITAAADYISRNYAKPLSLERMAGLCHINPYYFSRLFKKITGFTFIEYVNQVRVKEAQKLLIEGGVSVTEIAEAVGFETLSHFGRMFKLLTGMSPREYRKTYGGE